MTTTETATPAPFYRVTQIHASPTGVVEAIGVAARECACSYGELLTYPQISGAITEACRHGEGEAWIRDGKGGIANVLICKIKASHDSFELSLGWKWKWKVD